MGGDNATLRYQPLSADCARFRIMLNDCARFAYIVKLHMVSTGTCLEEL